MEPKPSARIHMLFFPLMTKGHILPMIQIAKLFSSRGAEVTFLTTPPNASTVSDADPSLRPRLRLISFPSSIEASPHPLSDLFDDFLEATSLLRLPFDEIIAELRPDCVVSDVLMPWTYDVLTARGIPRLVFDGFCFFARCLEHAFLEQNPLEGLPTEADSFSLDGLPHPIRMLRSQFPDPEEWIKPTPLTRIWNQAAEVDLKSYGFVINSFYDLEPDYVDHLRNAIGARAWGVGPVAISDPKSPIGIENEFIFRWLDEKKAGSIVYVCFGSMSGFRSAQLREIALALEASGHPFVWAVRSAERDWIPEGFEERGLLIWGWAPQVRILNHKAVGGFVTHCGWNSCLEGIAAGVPMATWPLFAEQFYNEKLLVELVGIAVKVGAKEYGMATEERKALVKAGMVEETVRRLMGGGEEEENRRKRAAELGFKARKAVEDGGSSFDDVGHLIQELIENKKIRG